ncbi:MAG: ankyrin repeat domain-containing protein [Pseudomonadota bacterium]|nr:ankyrin repeat domain-containing protein [Pseudomonadota bacterium]
MALLREAGAAYDLEARLANGDEEGLAALLREAPDVVAEHPDRERLKDLAGQGRTAREARRLIGLLGLGARPARKAAAAKPGPAELLAAAEEGKAAAVQKHLDTDPGLLAATNDDGDGPLHLAAWQGHRAVVTLILERGADLDAPGAGGQTPLHYAVRHGQAKVAKVLLDAGADPYRRDEGGASAWYAAALAADDDTIRVLDRSSHAPDLDAAVTLGRVAEVERCLAERPDAVRTHPDPARLWADAREAVELAVDAAADRAAGLKKARVLLDRLVEAGLPGDGHAR